MPRVFLKERKLRGGKTCQHTNTVEEHIGISKMSQYPFPLVFRAAPLHNFTIDAREVGNEGRRKYGMKKRRRIGMDTKCLIHDCRLENLKQHLLLCCTILVICNAQNVVLGSFLLLVQQV